MKRQFLALGLLLVLAANARADEIRLKDGSKILGTIVDFEDDSFKIQTAYGFALVRKDSIAQIIPAEPVESNEAAKAAPSAPAPARAVTPVPVSSPAVKPQAQAAVATAVTPSPGAKPVVTTPASAAAPVKPAVAAASRPMPAPNPRPATPAPVAAVEPSLVPAASTPPAATAMLAPAPPPPAPPPAPVGPLPIREAIQGNIYRNESYNFQLYRPPGWDVIPEARKALPNAITAMGTRDETTLFIVGRDSAHDSLEAQAANSERALQRVYENYRHVSSSKRTVGGLPAVEWRFRGIADGQDWSVTALTIARGTDVFTLLGMTYADSDQIMQIRENVIAKMLASLQFSAPR